MPASNGSRGFATPAPGLGQAGKTDSAADGVSERYKKPRYTVSGPSRPHLGIEGRLPSVTMVTVVKKWTADRVEKLRCPPTWCRYIVNRPD